MSTQTPARFFWLECGCVIKTTAKHKKGEALDCFHGGTSPIRTQLRKGSNCQPMEQAHRL